MYKEYVIHPQRTWRNVDGKRTVCNTGSESIRESVKTFVSQGIIEKRTVYKLHKGIENESYMITHLQQPPSGYSFLTDGLLTSGEYESPPPPRAMVGPVTP